MKHRRNVSAWSFISMSRSFSVPLGTEMFHFPRCPTRAYVFSTRLCGIPRTRFPHSEISGSTVACHLPGAYRRLLRPSSACSVEPSTVCPLLYNHCKIRYPAQKAGHPRAPLRAYNAKVRSQWIKNCVGSHYLSNLFSIVKGRAGPSDQAWRLAEAAESVSKGETKGTVHQRGPAGSKTLKLTKAADEESRTCCFPYSSRLLLHPSITAGRSWDKEGVSFKVVAVS